MTPKLTGGSGETRDALPLTNRVIDALKPASKPYRVPDARCPGLALRVAPGGGRTWDTAFRVRGAGAVRRKSLGPYPAVSIDEARRRAVELLRAAKAGRDVLAEEASKREEEARRVSVEGVLEQYLKRKVRGKLRTGPEIEVRLRRALQAIAHRAADDLRRRDIRELLNAVADRGVLREAEKQRQLLGAMFKWALGQDLIQADPSAGLSSFGTSPRRERVLADDETRELWAWLGHSNLPPDYADALRLQFATGARIGEVSGMRAEEVDRETELWTLPASRSKNKRPRITPLVGIAREIVFDRLETIARGPLFVTESGLALTSNHVGSMIVKRRSSIPVADFVSHDIRRTVATQMVDLGISYETVAAVLGHEAGGASVRILQRHYLRTDQVERKRHALQAWCGRLRELVNGDSQQPSSIIRIGKHCDA